MQPLKLEILEEGRQSGARKALRGQVIRPKARSTKDSVFSARPQESISFAHRIVDRLRSILWLIERDDYVANTQQQ
jgi:hypothetical protein